MNIHDKPEYGIYTMLQKDKSLALARLRRPGPDVAVLKARSGRRVVVPIAITLTVQSLVSMTAVTVPVFMPAASGELNFSPSYIGILVTLIYVGAAVSSAISGYFIDRFGPIFVSQICLLLSAIGLVVISIASIPWMILGALVIGFGYGPVTPASSQLLVKTTPPGVIAMVFSIKQTGVPLGGAMAGAVVPHLVLFYGWQAAAWVVGGFSIVSMLSIQPFRKRYDRGRSRTVRFSWRHVTEPLKMTFNSHSLRPIVVASFFFATMQLCLITFIVTYLTDDIGMTLIRAGIMLSVAQSSGIIGRIVWGALADRYFSPRMMLGILGIAMAGGALMAALFSAEWSHSAVLIVCALFGSVAIGWNGVYLAEVAYCVKPEYTAMITGGSLFFTFCGVLIGLPIFSMIVEKTGSYPVGFLSIAIATAIYGVILCFSRPFGKR